LNQAEHAADALALLGRRDRRVVLAHLLGEVPRDATRDERLDVRDARGGR
jgi:hypothetical protein